MADCLFPLCPPLSSGAGGGPTLLAELYFNPALRSPAPPTHHPSTLYGDCSRGRGPGAKVTACPVFCLCPFTAAKETLGLAGWRPFSSRHMVRAGIVTAFRPRQMGVTGEDKEVVCRLAGELKAIGHVVEEEEGGAPSRSSEGSREGEGACEVEVTADSLQEAGPANASFATPPPPKYLATLFSWWVRPQGPADPRGKRRGRGRGRGKRDRGGHRPAPRPGSRGAKGAASAAVLGHRDFGLWF